MVIALIAFTLWIIPGLFASRWWFKQHWPERETYQGLSGDAVIGWTIAIVFFWLYLGIAYGIFRGARKFYGA